MKADGLLLLVHLFPQVLHALDHPTLAGLCLFDQLENPGVSDDFSGVGHAAILVVQDADVFFSGRRLMGIVAVKKAETNSSGCQIPNGVRHPGYKESASDEKLSKAWANAGRS